MSRKGPRGTTGSSETLKKEDVVQAVVIVDRLQGEFRPIACDIPPVCCFNLYCIHVSLHIMNKNVMNCKSIGNCCVVRSLVAAWKLKFVQ
jgi:hypothetical protein